jgi:two-component system response regulator VicR
MLEKESHMSKKILIVEDEKPIADILKFNLEKEGYETLMAADGEEAVNQALGEDPDLILLDIMLPKKDGFQVLREVREKKQVPVLMLTAKAEEVDKVLGLELGADDYITKPFSIRELLARVKANLRRGDIQVQSAEAEEQNNFVKSGDLEIDINKYEVKKKDDVIELTLREFELLKFLATKSEQVFSREQLLEEVWGYEYYGDIRTVDVTVRRLREKIEDESSNPKYVITKRGVGYYFRRA